MGTIAHLDDYRETPYSSDEYLEIECTDEHVFDIGDSFEMGGITWEVAAKNGRTAYAKIAAAQH